MPKPPRAVAISLTAAIAAVAWVLACAVLAAPAGAKGVARLKVCGPAGCVDRTKEALKAAPPDQELILDAGMPVSDASVTAEPFVRLRVGVGDGRSHQVFGHYDATFLPRSGHMQTEDGGWSVVSPDGLRLLRRLSAGVSRYPASRLHLVSDDQPAEPAATASSTPVAAGAGGSDGTGGDGGGGGWWPLLVVAGVGIAGVGAAVALRRRRGPDDLGTAGGPAV
jgi:hypothetical protein